MKHSPPKWADRFLRWYCHPALLEEIQGDAYELFYRKVKGNKSVASLQFIWNVFRFFRWKNIRKEQSKNYLPIATDMIKNYLLTGFRNALRNRVSTFINVMGLSLGVSIAITVFIFIDNQLNTDGFHENKDRIYQVTNHVMVDSKKEDWGDSPMLLAPSLKNEVPVIEETTRIEFSSGAVRHNDVVFNESIWFVDPAFQKIFSFPLREGNNNALSNKSQIVITHDIAVKYFGNDTALGKPLSIKFSNNQKREFTVGAVVDMPYNSSIYFSILIPMVVFEDLKFKDAYDWSYLTDATFILLKPGHAISEVAASMNKYKNFQNSSSPEWPIEDFNFHTLKGLAQKNMLIISPVSGGASHAGLIALGTVATLLLLLACFNYMNVAVATVATRLKEIGIRKVIGSGRKELIQQFLTENLLLCTLSLLVGIGLSYYFFTPALDAIIPISIPFAFSSGKAMFLFFAGLLVFVALVSGAYPALYVSSFQPIQVLKGKEKFGQRSVFSRVLLTFQFFLAFTTIVGSFVFIDNSLYLKNKDWGYEHAQNYVVSISKYEQYLSLRDKISAQPTKMSLAGSVNHIGYQNPRISFEYKGQRFQSIHYKVGFDYLETMNLRLKEGRLFNKSIQTDRVESVVITELFAKKMNWDHPLNETFEVDSVKRVVIGIVENFQYEGFYNIIEPVMFSSTPEENYRFISVKTEEGKEKQTEAFLKTTWKEIAPDDPYTGFFQDEVFYDFHRDNDANTMILSFVSGVALILSCLGLFGLVSYNITRRLKEFSIRKVFGANTGQIFKLMNVDYIWILSISFLLGAPVGFFATNSLIQHIYPDPQSAGPLPFIIAVASMVVTVGVTIGLQMKRVVKENPALTLRND
ncbi:MAG: ABC transporter permease [Bacteroidota bacterium]